MQIIKRSGLKETFNLEKIAIAIKKAFISVNKELKDSELSLLLDNIMDKLNPSCEYSVEEIQDIVEEKLMMQGYYNVAKSFILYRQKRFEFRAIRQSLALSIGDLNIEACLEEIQNDFKEEEYNLSILSSKYTSIVNINSNVSEKIDILIKAACELTTPKAPKFEMIAGRILAYKFKQSLKDEEQKLGINDFYQKLEYLCSVGLYGQYILASYSKDELLKVATFIDNSRDKLFTFAGLDLLIKRYVIHSHKHVPLESIQEMFLGIALHLALKESLDRLLYVKKFYDLLSKLQVTMATPTLANARKPYHQLSSCFIDTVPDSLTGIYRSLDNFAQVSKFGGGMGLYFGKIRAMGSAIRGFEGAAGGIIRWLKLVNDTAVAVDQLGVRQGAVAVYLDIWHKDLIEFLQIRTNNGDDRMKAHDIFPALCIPNYFWEQARDNIDSTWYLMCPYEVFKVKGYHLEDLFLDDWKKAYLDCVNDNRINKRAILIKDLVRLILKSAVETGTPFIFNRDLVNEANPNSHIGKIYSSNLCTEICQNMSAIKSVAKTIETKDGEVQVVTTTKPGDFVVCNLASLSLGNINLDNDKELEDIVSTAIRALDNVIDLNFYPTPYAKLTNQKYRSIGLGFSGYHHMLANRYLRWESEEHLAYVDELFERINYFAIKSSATLAKEKGSYSIFKGSDWDTGAYFTKRNYTSKKWQKLMQFVKENGMRNAYLLATAPTSSTSIIAGTTAGCDPIMNRFFIEEKKGSMLPRVAPNLNQNTWWLYKNAHNIDQNYSIRACGIRQRHIDQSQSMNLYITNEYTMRQVLNLYIKAYECGVKTIYYVRSKALEVQECESCSA